MSEIQRISSPQNPLVKKVRLLKEKSRERKKSGLFVLEGSRELQMALKSGYEIKTLLFCPEIVDERQIPSQMTEDEGRPELTAVTKSVYRKMAHRETTEGIIAIAKSKVHTLDTLVLKNENPLILVAEAPEKPGNIGALLRTADAANIDAVIIADAKGDLYNPNIIRSSVGCLFTNAVALGSTPEVIAFLKAKKIAIYCAALTASKNYIKTDFRPASAIVVGTEATGLTRTWLDHASQNIVIPMLGEIDSMNVSVSAAILIFEAKRQRGYT